MDIARFINMCAADKICLFNIRKSGEKLTASTYLSSLERLFECAGRLGLEVTVTKRYGIPELFRRYKKRTGLFIGAAVFVLFIIGTQNFIWTVDVSGNSGVTTEQLLNAVNDAGVGFGTLKRKVNYDNIEAYLMTRFDNIAWVAVNIVGTRLHIEINEGDEAPKITANETEPRNIVAKKDGIITGMAVYMGQKEVKQGDVVAEGDILVNGIMEDKHGNSLFTRASAKIYAKTEFSKTFTVDMAVKQKSDIGQKGSLYSIKLGQSAFPIFNKNMNLPFELKRVYTIKLFGITLPVEIVENEYYSYSETDVIISEHRAVNTAKYLCSVYEKTELAEAKIIGKKGSVERKDNKIFYTVDYVCNENIAKTEKIYIESEK